jgi:asparagine synthase (glutamine-hydrolysing)
MCGITGVFSADGIVPYLDALQAASRAGAHRGPDGDGVVLLDPCKPQQPVVSFDGEPVSPEGGGQNLTVALSHRRLAILDLSSAGRQPMVDESGTLWITYNGEIYNYLELRDELQALGYRFRSHSDTEVILCAYDAWGDACVNRFNGMWAFVIADLNLRRLFCSRDRFGIKPFHYFFDGHRFAFSSEIKQLLCFPFVPRKLSERAVYEFLAFAAVDYDEDTFFAGVKKLLQGHSLTLDLATGQLAITRYYQPVTTLDRDITPHEAAMEFRRLLTDSVRLHLRSDVEVGSCLSGGLDSSSLVCLMRQLLDADNKSHVQRTFSSHFEEEEANERGYMQTVIETTGVRALFSCPKPDEFLHDLDDLVWHQDEPFGSTSIFAQWAVFKLVHQHGVKVMLDGQGADEQLAGYLGLSYSYFTELYVKQRYSTLLRETWTHARQQNKEWLPLLPAAFLRRLRISAPAPASSPPQDWVAPRFAERYQPQSRYLANQQLRPFGETEHLNNTLYQLTFHNNLQALLRHEDRNSMAFSVESRVPFLDHRLVEFIFSLPSHLKIRHGYTKRVLRDGMAGVIPERIRWRTGKLGFATPERSWQKSILRKLLDETLGNERLREFIVIDRARAYQARVEEMGIFDPASWRWINLHLWMQTFEV